MFCARLLGIRSEKVKSSATISYAVPVCLSVRRSALKNLDTAEMSNILLLQPMYNNFALNH